MSKKLTKKEMFMRLSEVLGSVETQDKEELVSFVERELELLTAKAEKAKGYKRKTKEDPIKEMVYCRLDKGSFLTVRDIVQDIDDKDISAAKVTARLTAFVKEGLAIKEQVVVETETDDGKIKKSKLMGYKLA